jgi:hypothetical protein
MNSADEKRKCETAGICMVLEVAGDGGAEVAGTVAAEGEVDFLEAVDEIAHESARGGATGGIAKMRAAAEGAGVVDLAESLFQERACAIAGGGEIFATAGAPGLGGEQGLAAGEVGGFSGELEAATGGAADAVAVDGAAGEFLIDRFHLGDQGGGIGAGGR